jgi:hypothetical protein
MGGNGMVKGAFGSNLGPEMFMEIHRFPFSPAAAVTAYAAVRASSRLDSPRQSVARRMLHSPISPPIRFWREWLSPILSEPSRLDRRKAAEYEETSR